MLGDDCGAVVVIACVGADDVRVRGGKWAHYIREHVVRQPRHTVVVRLACPHPVARNVLVALRATGGLACIIPRGEKGATKTDREARLPVRPASGIGVQLHRRAKSLSFVGGANVIDVGRVAPCAVLVTDVVNNAVESGSLTPALVSPVATVIRKHTCEVAHSGDSGSRKWSADVGIGPGVSAIGGAEEVVG